MAHAIATHANGRARMVFTGATPWHGLGTQFANPPTIEEVIAELKADVPVVLEQLQLPNGEKVEQWAATRDGQVYGYHGGRFTVLQDSELIEACRPLLETAEIETAAHLNEGARFFMCMRFKDNFTAEVVKGDPVQGYALAAHGHDGMLSATMGLTSVRVVCANTLAAAQGEGSLVKFRHTASCKANVQDAGAVLAQAHGVWAKELATWQYMAGRTMSRAQFKAFATKLMGLRPAKPKAVTVTQPVAPNVVTDPSIDPVALIMGNTAFSMADNTPEPYAGYGVMPDPTDLATQAARSVDLLCELFENGVGNTMQGVAGTNWAGFNAVTQYLTHHYGRGGGATAQGNRLVNNNFGLTAKLLSKATTMLTTNVKPWE